MRILSAWDHLAGRPRPPRPSPRRGLPPFPRGLHSTLSLGVVFSLIQLLPTAYPPPSHQTHLNPWFKLSYLSREHLVYSENDRVHPSSNLVVGSGGGWFPSGWVRAPPPHTHPDRCRSLLASFPLVRKGTAAPSREPLGQISSVQGTDL